MMVDLGGPGTACSATRVRRFRAGELRGAELERTEQHLRECARCQAVLHELDEERARLLRDVPFDVFAAGVAEKLARTKEPPRWSRWVPLAAAAALLLALGTSLTVRRGTEDDDGLRTKGGATVALYERTGVEVRAVEHTVGTGPVSIRTNSAGHPYMAVILAEPSESSILYSGPSRSDVPTAFEWTGTARRATLIAVFADRPIDADAIRARGARAAPRGAEIVEVPLERAP
jgi:hypothetical protein